MTKKSMIPPMNETRAFLYRRRSREVFLGLALVVGIVLPGAAAQSIGGAASPDAQAGIKFNESYFVENIFFETPVFDMAFNSKGKSVFTADPAQTGADLFFYSGNGTATTGETPNNAAYGIATDSVGNFWFVDSNSVGVVNSKGQITDYTPPGNYSFEGGITLGSDGAMWVGAYTITEGQQNSYIGRFAGDGTFTSYPIPSNVYLGNFQSIATGSDGNVWFQAVSSSGSDELLVSVTPSGKMTSYVTETNCSYDSGIHPLHAVVLGPDGNIWFSSQCGLGIGNITPSGVVTFFPFIDPDDPEAGFDLASGSDGAIWFITPVLPGQETHLGRITTSGSVTYTDIPNLLGDWGACGNDELYPTVIVPGPKGTLQFYAETAYQGKCGAVISFTPAPPGIDQDQPLHVQPAGYFACADGQAQCEFDVYGGGYNFFYGQEIWELRYTLANDLNGYAVGVDPGENFALCDKVNGNNGQALYASFSQQAVAHVPTKKYGVLEVDGFVANTFSSMQTGLAKGTKITCTFPFNFSSCYVGGGDPAIARATGPACITNNTQILVFKTIVGP